MAPPPIDDWRGRRTRWWAWGPRYEADGLAESEGLGLAKSDGLGLAGLDGLELEPASVGALLGAACDGAAVGTGTSDGVGVAVGPQAAIEAAMAMIARRRFTVDLLL